MANVKVETLTPLHIGSGVKLLSNSEYVYFAGEKVLAPVDPRKVIRIIGKDNIKQWVTIIDRGDSLLDFIKQKNKNISPADVALRIVPVPGIGPVKGQQVREHIHNGMGLPYLPGSSLKGSLTTAILAELIKKNTQLQQTVKTKSLLGKEKFDRKTQQKKFDFKQDELLKQAFGSDPNHSTSRFVQVGDAHFNSTAALLLQSPNYNGNEWKFKTSINQFVECVTAKQTSVCRINFEEDTITKKFNASLKTKLNGYIGLSTSHLSEENLFSLVNANTTRLLNKELKFLEKQNDPIFRDYAEAIKKLLQKTENCDAHSCVLRIGFGSNFNFITGGWQEEIMLQQDYETLKRSLRRVQYGDFFYPKTRRFADKGQPLGFVQLTIIGKDEYEQLLNQKTEEIAITVSSLASPEPIEIILKPTYFTGKIKSGIIVDGQFHSADKFNPAMKKIKLLTEGEGKEQIVELKYVSDIPPDAIIKCRVRAESKGKIQAIEVIQILKK